MTVAELYRAYKARLKKEPDYDLERCRYYFGGAIISRVTKRRDYFIYTLAGMQRVTGKERVQ